MYSRLMERVDMCHPNRTTCRDYLEPYIAVAGGKVYNGSVSDDDQYISILSQFDVRTSMM